MTSTRGSLSWMAAPIDGHIHNICIDGRQDAVAFRRVGRHLARVFHHDWEYPSTVYSPGRGKDDINDNAGSGDTVVNGTVHIRGYKTVGPILCVLFCECWEVALPCPERSSGSKRGPQFGRPTK